MAFVNTHKDKLKDLYFFKDNKGLWNSGEKTSKEYFNYARQKWKHQKIKIKSLDKPIEFSSTALKEFVNQPHKFKKEKNNLLFNLDNVLKNSKYVGVKPDYKNNPNVLQIHLLEVLIKKEKSYFIVREMKDTGKLILYSISDSEKVLK